VAMFLISSDTTVYHSDMTSESNLRLANPDEIAPTLSFALRHDGRKRVHHADEAMEAAPDVMHGRDLSGL
jgi:hypothetical protein